MRNNDFAEVSKIVEVYATRNITQKYNLERHRNFSN